MSDSNKRTFRSRRPETYVTIREIVSADPEAEGGFMAKNGVPVAKPVVIGMVENKVMGDGRSTITISDGGRDVIQVTAFGDDMPIVEMVSRGDWIIVSGFLRYGKKKHSFYVTPLSVEKIDAEKLDDLLRWWYLNLAFKRISSRATMPKDPISRILAEEKIEGLEIADAGNGWIEARPIQKKKPQRVLTKRSDKSKGKEDLKNQVLKFLQEKAGKSGELDIKAYLAWASENSIKTNVAESVMVELSNEGLIKESEDRRKLILVRSG